MATLNDYILGRRRYRVIAAAIVASSIGGGEKYVYKNGMVPADTEPTQIEKMLELGLIVETEGSNA